MGNAGTLHQQHGPRHGPGELGIRAPWGRSEEAVLCFWESEHRGSTPFFSRLSPPRIFHRSGNCSLADSDEHTEHTKPRCAIGRGRRDHRLYRPTRKNDAKVEGGGKRGGGGAMVAREAGAASRQGAILGVVDNSPRRGVHR